MIKLNLNAKKKALAEFRVNESVYNQFCITALDQPQAVLIETKLSSCPLQPLHRRTMRSSSPFEGEDLKGKDRMTEVFERSSLKKIKKEDLI